MYEAGHCNDKQTLRIGPVRPGELHELKTFIQSLTPDTHRATLAPDEFKEYIRHRTTGRNEPCPCGSGKKFKKCCGTVQ